LVGAAVRYRRFDFATPLPDLSELEPTPGAQVAELFDRLGIEDGFSMGRGISWG